MAQPTGKMLALADQWESLAANLVEWARHRQILMDVPDMEAVHAIKRAHLVVMDLRREVNRMRGTSQPPSSPPSPRPSRRPATTRRRKR